MMATQKGSTKEREKGTGSNSILVKSIQVVTFIFAAFGHFLHDIAPPEEGGTQFAVGISSLLALCVLLYVSAISKNLPSKKFKRAWLIAAGAFMVMALSTALLYQSNFLKYTFRFPHDHSEEIYFGGTAYTAKATQYRQENPGKSIQQVLLDFGGLEARTTIWPEHSIRAAMLWLTTSYIAFVLSVAAAIFSLTEGILARPKSA
jgi:hypothetical protein